MCRYAAVIAASLSWVFGYGLYVAARPAHAWAAVGIALIAGAIGFAADAERFRPRPKLLLLLLPLAIPILCVPPWAGPPFLLLAAGIVLAGAGAAKEPFAPLRRAGYAAVALGAVLAVQAPLAWLITAWTARNPHVPFLASVLYRPLSWIGADVSLCGHSLFIRTMQDLHEFPLTWGHLDLLVMVQVWAGTALLFWWQRGRLDVLKRLTAFTALLIAYAVARLFVLLAVFITAQLFEPYGSKVVHVQLFWTPWISIVSWAPLLPFAASLLPWPAAAHAPEGVAAHAPADRGALRRAGVLASACAACAGLALFACFPDPGAPKTGRVLIDEAHSDWERTDRPYDTDWYGGESEYNYYCMAQYLGHFHDLSANMEGPLTPEKLAACDVLILKSPTTPYEPAEIDAIESFVRAGGGLFLLGEHTDVFGTSSCLNPVARRFGMAFRPDAVFDITRKWEQVYIPSRPSAHPILGQVPFFRFAVSCSIDTFSWNARAVVRGRGLWTLPIEYAASNFYPQVEDRAYATFGAVDQVVAVYHGRGRVVAFSDSTVYSNFDAFYPGKPQLLLGTIQWLNRANRWRWVAQMGLGLFVTGLIACAVFARGGAHDTRFATATVCAASATVCVVLWACALLGAFAYPAPRPHKPVNEVAFDLEHGSLELPIFAFTQDHNWSYQVFYQWVLRTGCFPAATFDLREALASHRMLVIVHPGRDFDAGAIADVRAFLERGGSLLVLDSPHRRNARINRGPGREPKGAAALATPDLAQPPAPLPRRPDPKAAWSDSTANQLVEHFGMSFGSDPCAGAWIVEPTSGARVCRAVPARPVTGGTPLLQTDGGATVLAFAPVGKGFLIAAGIADRFVDTRMGYSSRRIPDRELRAVYALQFALLRGMVNGDLAEQIAALGRLYADTRS